MNIVIRRAVFTITAVLLALPLLPTRFPGGERAPPPPPA